MNIDVDKINEQHLRELVGEEFVYEQYTTGSENYVQNLQRSVLASSRLVLKLGALVMAVKNDASRRYVNGSIGTVIGFEPVTNYPIVEFTNGRKVTMQPDSWEMRDGDKKRASISQIPLRLAYAITVHKSQGMTLDMAKIDLRKAFVEGMGYVALSRVRDIGSLYLIGINQMALRISPEAQQIDVDLRRAASGHVKKFAHLQEQAKKRSAKALKKKKAGGSASWQEKIAKMRETHPKAYMPWEKQDDEILKQGFLSGETIGQLSKKLGRHEGSIKIRLQKHFGEDMVQ